MKGLLANSTTNLTNAKFIFDIEVSSSLKQHINSQDSQILLDITTEEFEQGDTLVVYNNNQIVETKASTGSLLVVIDIETGFSSIKVLFNKMSKRSQVVIKEIEIIGLHDPDLNSDLHSVACA